MRRSVENDSIFMGEDNLIKGVAGAILWRLLSDCAEQRRTEHSNRELRLDPAIRLPDLSENLEARVILLQRRPTGMQQAPQRRRGSPRRPVVDPGHQARRVALTAP